MSTNYSFYLRVGFQVPTQELKKRFQHRQETKEEGVFHMEDRFDPKTGAKIDPVKVWDKEPQAHTDTWWVIEGERFEDWDDESISALLEEELGCGVDAYWQSYRSNDGWSYGFYPHPHNNKTKMGDGNKFRIHNTNMDYSDVVAMQPALEELKQKLQDLGINPGEPKVFLGEISG